jgi:hypothetical protein
MLRRKDLISLLVIGVALLGSGCGGASDEEAAVEPGRVEAIKGTGRSRVILTAEAAKRIDVRTVPAKSAPGNRTMIPFDAVLYDSNGDTWTYTSPKRFVYVRQDIIVNRVDGDRAILSAGPASGTPVVTLAATEIWGVEYGGIEED